MDQTGTGQSAQVHQPTDVCLILDPAHRRIDPALREAGHSVNGELSEALAVEVEQQLYALLQKEKYDHD